MDQRIVKLSKTLTGYSCDLKPNEKVLIEFEGEAAKPLVRQLIKDAYELGAKPYVNQGDNSILREILLNADDNQIEFLNEYQLHQMEGMDAYILIESGENISELSDVPADKLSMYQRLTRPITNQRTNHTKWVIVKYPNPSIAQLANTSLESFEDYYFDVCTFDYKKMSEAMNPLVELMSKTDKVHINGPGTDLTFSIKDIPVIKCDGRNNVPDGEIFTAPVRESMNGVITYNAASEYQGFTYENVKFQIENGKIVETTANNTERINALLDTDEGARYFGEFAIGVNPHILHPMRDILFDEKISGSFHLTPGASYEDAPNGNKSAIHWDLVMVQRQDYGGGEIWFDDVLIRKDGVFVLPELEELNLKN